jgi:diguanylate cyclase (GGDEF)-like protein
MIVCQRRKMLPGCRLRYTMSSESQRGRAFDLRHILLNQSGLNFRSMKMHAALDLEHFSDSTYATELRRKFPDLRFAAELEKEFQAFHLERVRSRVRFFQLAICALALAAGVHLIIGGIPAADVAFGWIGIVVPTSLFLVWASWSDSYERIYLPAARVAVPVLAVASAIGVGLRGAGGQPDPFYFLTTYSLALFFLGGQLFRESLTATVAMIIAFGATLALVGHPPESIAYYVSVLAITGAVGTFVYRGVERQLRTSFLERGLMGEMAARDGLTGLKNRGAFDDYFPRMWQQALRDRRSIAILLIDVDHFKAYNDRYGHQAGDKTLRGVAQVVQEFGRRPLDLAARYGGEEFVLALFDLSTDHVRSIAEQLRASIHALNITHEDSATAPFVTASIGVAIVGPRVGRNPDRAVQIADEALYCAKSAGRNRVNVVECDPSTLATHPFRRWA